MRARESRQRAVARGKITNVMACKCVNGEYLFHQPCGLWNDPCVHGCGYIHLSNSTPGTRKKCCINGHLSSASDNFDEELMMGYVLDELPVFVRKVISNSNKVEGHYCLICREQHYLTSTDLATFETEAQCEHVYCYVRLSSRKSASGNRNLTCP